MGDVLFILLSVKTSPPSPSLLKERHLLPFSSLGCNQTLYKLLLHPNLTWP